MRLFDMHCDTLYECCKGDMYLDRNRLHIDLERGGRYAQWGQAFAVWMPDTLRGEAAFEQCRDMLLFAHDQAALYADRMQIIRTGGELKPVLESGRCTLDDSLKLFEEGTKLTAYCSKALKTAEQKIVKLTAAEEPQRAEEPALTAQADSRDLAAE